MYQNKLVAIQNTKVIPYIDTTTLGVVFTRIAKEVVNEAVIQHTGNSAMFKLKVLY